MMVTAQVPDLLIYDETQYVVDRLDEVLTQIILKFHFQHNGGKLFKNNDDDGDAMISQLRIWQ